MLRRGDEAMSVNENGLMNYPACFRKDTSTPGLRQRARKGPDAEAKNGAVA